MKIKEDIGGTNIPDTPAKTPDIQPNPPKSNNQISLKPSKSHDIHLIPHYPP